MTTGSLFWPIVIAGSGGVFVLIGLLMEMFAEKPWHKNLSDFRRSKCINLCGEWLVIIGICTEIYVAADAAIKERKTETAIAKNDPMNRPVENISCSFIFRFAGKTGAGEQMGFETESWMELLETNIESRTLYLGRFQRLLVYSVVPFENRDSATNYHGCTITFAADPLMTGVESGHVIKDNKPITPGFVLERIRALRFHLAFLPSDAEIMDGKAEILVNQESKSFNIQANQSSNDPILFNPDGSRFFIYATNSIP